ncbi:MAG: hypothetical protein Q9223_000821 [Gallowayella weberi]
MAARAIDAGRDAIHVVPSAVPNWPQIVTPHPLAEPCDIRIPLALHFYDKKQIDADYMGFIIVMDRIWPSYLRPNLEAFCRSKEPSSLRQELVEEEVRRLMWMWASNQQVQDDFPHVVLGPWDWARINYELWVRIWHVQQHHEEYAASAVLRLRQLGYMIGD